MTTAVTPTPGELVQAKTVCLSLRIGSFGNTKQAALAGAVFSKDDQEKEPDKTLLHLSKTLLDSPELTAIQKFDRQLSASIRSMAFPSPLFKGGVYLIPIAMVTTAVELIESANEKRKKLIEEAVTQYPTRVGETKKRLGSVASDLDYPGEDRFRQAFYMEHSLISFETPTRLKAISMALFESEKAKARVQLESVAVECQQAMRAGLAQLVAHLAERLTPDADGKQKRLSNSTIENLNEFLKVFELKDVTDDAQLGALVVKARAVMNGVDHKKLKSDDAIRQSVLDELGNLAGALQPLIVDKGSRMISFDE